MTTITLNESLSFVDTSNHRQIEANRIAKYFPVKRHTKLDYIKGSIDTLNLKNHGLFGLISHAYTYHKPLTINPTDVWILILSQFKTIIKDNAETYRHLFTDSPDKKTLAVPTNSLYELPVDLLIKTLNEYINFDSKLIQVEFSTDTAIANEVKNHLLLDMTSPYYNYAMFLCGIPSIKIGGHVEDWERLYSAFLKLNEVFYLKEEDEYLLWQCSVTHILDILLMASQGNYDIDFFRDIFTQKNIGSGGELEIKGWITNLFYKMPKVAKIENFNSHVSCVEYKNLTTQKEYVMISGGFSYTLDEDGYHALSYSKHIFEIITV